MFLILALPRSRTYWLSKLLTYGDYECGHEEVRHLRSIDDAKIWMAQEFRGSAETALAPFWRLIARANPDLRVVVIRRPVEEVVKSMMALDLRGIFALDRDKLRKHMTYLDGKLEQLSKRMPNVLSVDFHDLKEGETVKDIFEHCLPYPFDLAWWHKLRPQNLQCNMRHLMREMVAYREPLDRVAKTAASLSRAQVHAKAPISSEGVTFQEESFEAWVRDGVGLFEEHLIAVGEAPDNWKNKNLPLFKMMYEAGYMQITTARSNGRMFGYLVTVLNPSLEERGAFSGLNTMFYVSKDMPGIGVKLQRASVAGLQARGAKAAVFYEGIRGSGPRLGALYRRLGAQEMGKLYRVEFEGIV